MIALVLECIQGTSVFYVQGFPFLVTLTVVTGVVVGWQAWIAGRLWVLRATRYNALVRGWRPGAGMDQLGATATPLIPNAAYTAPPASAPAPILDASLKTPMGGASLTLTASPIATAYSSSFSPSNVATGHRVAHTGKTD